MTTSELDRLESRAKLISGDEFGTNPPIAPSTGLEVALAADVLSLVAEVRRVQSMADRASDVLYSDAVGGDFARRAIAILEE